MTTRFRRPSLTERFTQLGYLLKNTATIVGRDADILQPLVRMGIYAASLVCVFFAVVWLYATGANGTATMLLGVCTVAFVYKFFYYNRQELAMSWLVYETAGGRDRNLDDAHAQVRELGSQIRTLALLDMAAAWIARRSRNDKQGFIDGLVLSALTEGWDLVNHFMLPVFAIERTGFKDGMERLRVVRENVPETLAGVFGIDILGRVVGGVMAPVYVILAVLGTAGGLFLSGWFPAAFNAGEIGALLPADALAALNLSGDTTFNWFPLATAIFLGKLFSAVFERVVTALKVIYFTLFYTRTVRPDALADDLRDELERYLELSGSGEQVAA
ncbi:MAG: hypothetical protein ACODAC_09560 [Pseudomonadota bacterium]